MDTLRLVIVAVILLLASTLTGFLTYSFWKDPPEPEVIVQIDNKGKIIPLSESKPVVLTVEEKKEEIRREFKCPAGTNDEGLNCVYQNPQGTLPLMECEQGFVLNNGICQQRDIYDSQCPAGTTSTGTSCVYIRPNIPKRHGELCSGNEDSFAGACYNMPKEGFSCQGVLCTRRLDDGLGLRINQPKKFCDSSSFMDSDSLCYKKPIQNFTCTKTRCIQVKPTSVPIEPTQIEIAIPEEIVEATSDLDLLVDEEQELF